MEAENNNDNLAQNQSYQRETDQNGTGIENPNDLYGESGRGNSGWNNSEDREDDELEEEYDDDDSDAFDDDNQNEADTDNNRENF